MGVKFQFQPTYGFGLIVNFTSQSVQSMIILDSSYGNRKILKQYFNCSEGMFMNEMGIFISQVEKNAYQKCLELI